jgi:hypothetical protein
LTRSDRDLPAYFDDAVAWKAEEIADVHGVSLHRGEERLLPFGQTLPVAPVNDRFAGDVIGDVVGSKKQPCSSARLKSKGMSGLSMNPKRAVARQKFGATSIVTKRSDALIHGLDSITTLRTNRWSCNALLCLTCQATTGGVSLKVLVRKTAVPGTRGILRDSSELMNSLTGIARALRTCATVVEPRCQINMTP